LDRIDADNLPAALNAHAEAMGWPFRCDPQLNFTRAELAALCDLWRAKAGADGPPKRAMFDMRTLRPFLRNVSLLERIGPKGAWRYRFRLFGSALVNLFGEHTGHFLDEMVSPALLANWTACYDITIRYGSPLRFLNYYRIPNKDFLKGEILAAPLMGEVEDQPMILAATYVGLKDGTHSPIASLSEAGAP